MHKQIRRHNKVKKSNHLITFSQTLNVKLKCKKRLLDDSSALPHKTHKEDPSVGRQFHLARFLLKGILSKSFQEKATTFRGSLLFQIHSKTLFSSIVQISSTTNILSNFK